MRDFLTKWLVSVDLPPGVRQVGVGTMAQQGMHDTSNSGDKLQNSIAGVTILKVTQTREWECEEKMDRGFTMQYGAIQTQTSGWTFKTEKK